MRTTSRRRKMQVMEKHSRPAFRRVVLAAALIVAPAGLASALESTRDAATAESPAYAELPNFHRVDDNLFRGGQPGTDGIGRLKEMGIKTIVNLRYERELVDAEAAEARAAGIRYYNVPMVGLNRPTDAQVAHILALIDDPANRPVFVHCKAGSDRTGAVVACYRIARAQWTAKRAIEECFHYGMMRIEFAKRAFIRGFYAKLQGGAAGV